MKQKLLMTATMLAAVVALSAIPGYSVIPYHMRVNVPFSFIVGTTRLPADEYEISTPNINSNYTLLIREVNGHTSLLVQTMPMSLGHGRAHKTELVFDRVGQDEFLRQIWEQGLQTGDQCLESRREKQELARAHESNLPNTDVVPASTTTG